MTRRRLAWLLQSRGTDLAAWPDHDRLAALSLLRRSRSAQRLLADALAAEDAPEPNGAMLARMQHGLRLRLAPPPAMVRGMGWGALAACAAAGLYIGVGVARTEAMPQADLFSAVQTDHLCFPGSVAWPGSDDVP